jgi:DNA mismatch endonuclease (patch repair protein)
MAADNLNPSDRRKTMQAVKGKNTGLERKLFSMLAGMGIQGWHKNVADIKGKPDVVFDKQRIVIFVDGCFWHGCPSCKGKTPVNNFEYWNHKVTKNKARDKKTRNELIGEKWRVVRIWEHDMRDRKSRQEIRSRIRSLLKGDGCDG